MTLSRMFSLHLLPTERGASGLFGKLLPLRIGHEEKRGNASNCYEELKEPKARENAAFGRHGDFWGTAWKRRLSQYIHTCDSIGNEPTITENNY